MQLSPLTRCLPVILKAKLVYAACEAIFSLQLSLAVTEGHGHGRPFALTVK